MVIEQEQIVTTHNLAVLVQELGLREGLRLQLDDLARGCFTWICRRQQQKIDAWRPRLRMIKNSAYAWRQMVFFLALLPSDSLDAFLGWAYEHLGQQRPAFQTAFRPALDGLALVARDGSLDVQDQRSNPGDVQRLLGWTTERHWLMRDS